MLLVMVSYSHSSRCQDNPFMNFVNCLMSMCAFQLKQNQTNPVYFNILQLDFCFKVNLNCSSRKVSGISSGICVLSI